MSAQPTVLQVVIMRDGLLVGTEVFVPGQYTLGSGDGADLRLDDASVGASHATLYFQNGRAAIQDGGGGATFVNGHKITACEVRPVDEIACGPFTLKIRVMGQKPANKQAPPANIGALLGGPPAGTPQPRPAPVQAQSTPRPAAVPSPQPTGKPQPPATVVSNRRMNAAAQPAEPVVARHLRPVPMEDLEPQTESVSLGAEVLMPTRPSNASLEMSEDMLTMPLPPGAAISSNAATVQARAAPHRRRHTRNSARRCHRCD